MISCWTPGETILWKFTPKNVRKWVTSLANYSSLVFSIIRKLRRIWKSPRIIMRTRNQRVCWEWRAGLQTINNYSPKWRWLAVNIYRAARSGDVNVQRYPPTLRWIVVLVHTKAVRSYTPQKLNLDDFFTCHGRSPRRHFLLNYSPKWRWLVVDIYLAASQLGKYPTLATDTEVNSCFSIYS